MDKAQADGPLSLGLTDRGRREKLTNVRDRRPRRNPALSSSLPGSMFPALEGNSLTTIRVPDGFLSAVSNLGRRGAGLFLHLADSG